MLPLSTWCEKQNSKQCVSKYYRNKYVILEKGTKTEKKERKKEKDRKKTSLYVKKKKNAEVYSKN